MLNDADRIDPAACERYFCTMDARGRRTCVLGPEDADGDGVPKCGPEPVDCDDTHETVAPTAPELACNGVDDDCNGVIDDGAFALAPSIVVPSLGETERLSFAAGSDGVSAAAWSIGSVATTAVLGTAGSGAVSTLAYSATSRAGLTSLSSTGREPGCVSLAPGAVSCPSSGGVTCNGPGADGLPWLANLPGDGHFCGATGCDVCDDDADCPGNTLPRTCDRTATSRSCAPRSVVAAPELGPANCCAGQVLESGATPATGSDPSACCTDAPRACVRGVCRDVCSVDADCPLIAFESGVPRPVFGACVDGGCVAPGRPDLEGPAPGCNATDVALDRIGGVGAWIVAAVSTRGCAGGQLRVGISPAADPAVIQTVGPESRSNLFAGVDVDVAGLGCSGISRSDGVRGVSRPAVSALRTPAGEDSLALVVSLARPLDEVDCGGTDEFAVEALGVYVPAATGSEPLVVHGTDAGVPAVVGRSTGAGRPAVTAVSALGWVVGFGTSAGPALRVVPRLEPLPSLAPACTAPADCVSPLECVGAGAALGACRLPCVGSTDCGSDALTCCTSTTVCTGGTLGHCIPSMRGHVARPTTMLRVAGAGLTVAAAPADHVRITVGPSTGALVDLGIAWQQGCGAAARVLFTRVQLDFAASSIVAGGPVVDLAAGRLPVVAFVDDGVLRVGSRTPAGDTVDAMLDGGYVVAWVDAEGVAAARLDERGQRVVDVTPVRVSELGGVEVEAVHLFGSTSVDARLEFAFAEAGTTAALRAGALACRAEAE